MKPASPQVTLYDYQAIKVDSALRHIKAGRDVLLEEPTGSGKTLQGVAFLGLALGKAFTHAIVIAPQRQIESGFLGRNGSVILWPEGANRSRPIRVPAGFVRSARQGCSGAVAEILAYLATPNPGYVLATTHAAMTALFRTGLAEFPERLERSMLFVDEAHHNGAKGLSMVTHEWAARGGSQIYATATPFRGDGIDPAREGMVRLRRTLTEHIEAGFAPKNLGNEIVAIGAKGDRVTGKEFAGESVPNRRCRAIAKSMADKWVAKGKPKTIIRVPPIGGGCQALVAELASLLRKSGARVLDATGTGKEQQKRFLAVLDAERVRSFAESQYDVIIGCMRVLEGSDWPLCSHVFCLGIPRPIGTVIQLIGRAMRKKAADHPSAEHAEIVFFVPCAGGDALGALSLDHSRHALLVAAYMADYAIGEEYAVVDAIRKGLAIKPGDDLEIEVDEAARIDPALIAEAKVHIAQTVEDRPEITLPELVEHVVSAMPEAPRNDVVGIVLRIKAAEKTPGGKKVRDAIEGGFAGGDKVCPDIAAERRRVFDEVLERFRDETLADSDGLKGFAAQVHALTAGGMRGVAQRLREAAAVGGPLTEEMIVEWMRQHFERTGKLPTSESGEVFGTAERWDNLTVLLRLGLRGLTGGISLADLKERHFGYRNHMNLPDLHIPTVRKWVKKYRAEHRKNPTSKSGNIPGSNGETWSSVNTAFGSKSRGAHPYSSLADFLAKEFSHVHPLNLPDLHIPTVRKWVKAYWGEHGKFPTKESGIIPGGRGEKWSSVDGGFRKGKRGSHPYTSLADFLVKEFGYRNLHDLPDLDIPTVRRWVEEYCAKFRKYPNSASGDIPGSGGETWSTVNSAFKNGARGAHPYTSLINFLAKEFGHRSHLDCPRLNIQTIVKWIGAYLKVHKRFPTRKSGEIPGSNGETWGRVDDAGKTGGRGLSKGDTLARIIAEHFPDAPTHAEKKWITRRLNAAKKLAQAS